MGVSHVLWGLSTTPTLSVLVPLHTKKGRTTQPSLVSLSHQGDRPRHPRRLHRCAGKHGFAMSCFAQRALSPSPLDASLSPSFFRRKNCVRRSQKKRVTATILNLGGVRVCGVAYILIICTPTACLFSFIIPLIKLLPGLLDRCSLALLLLLCLSFFWERRISRISASGSTNPTRKALSPKKKRR